MIFLMTRYKQTKLNINFRTGIIRAKYFSFKLDIPVRIQYVVGNMLRFFLKRERDRSPGSTAGAVTGVKKNSKVFT